jgi:chromosome segregation ATPase
MYESQTKAQQEEYHATQDALAEAQTEMQALNLEQKQLLQQWNSSVIGMKRRDEALSAMNTAVNLQVDRLQSLSTEIDGYKRSIAKEQEKNETLTIQYRKLENDLSLVKRQMSVCESKREALRVEYSKFTRILQESEQDLTKATTDCTLLQNDMVSLRKQTEREVLEKNELEDAILEKTMTQLTLDKASAYTRQEANKTRKKIKEGETTVAQVENELARQVLDISNTSARLERLQQVINEQNEEVKQLNSMITRGENEVMKRNAVIERKQGMIDQMNKKIDQLTSGKDGVIFFVKWYQKYSLSA